MLEKLDVNLLQTNCIMDWLIDMENNSRLDYHLSLFHEVCNSKLEVYYNVLQMYNNEKDYPLFTKNIRDMLVDYSILCIYSSWEKFLENIFISYMMGEKSNTGDSVNLYVHPVNEEHAYNLIKSTNQYPEWSDIEKVLVYAYNFFEDGGSFKFLSTMKTELNALKKIRNCIAHSSIKALKDFEDLVRGNIGYLPTNITTASYVIDYGPKKINPRCSYYEYYLQYLKNASTMLVEYKK